ncbi:MAG: hypothetical protein ACLUS6_15665 [Dysosmobacter sp.]
MPKRRANRKGTSANERTDDGKDATPSVTIRKLARPSSKTSSARRKRRLREKLKKAIEENVGIDYGKAKTYTVGSWLEMWMENYAKIKLRPSTFKTSQGFLKNHIQTADWQHSAGRVDLSGLAAVLQAPVGRWPGRPH